MKTKEKHYTLVLRQVVFFLGVFSVGFIVSQCQNPRNSPKGSSDEGARQYLEYCAKCHSERGNGGPAPGNLPAPDIRKFTKSPAELEEIINNGFGKMPALKDTIPANEVPMIARYVASQIEYHAQ